MGQVSNTVRSMKLLEAEGWVPWVVERRLTRFLTVDLFNILDIVALHPPTGRTKGIQTTSASNLSTRIKKIEDSEHLVHLRTCGWEIEAHGWRKSKGRWVCNRRDIS